ncbi:hypothetical protein OAU02_02060 [Candidatus Pseudothioglobus singularis]|nr:hypothetical protein [Candidatus Pseudothioglobus singularis]
MMSEDELVKILVQFGRRYKKRNPIKKIKMGARLGYLLINIAYYFFFIIKKNTSSTELEEDVIVFSGDHLTYVYDFIKEYLPSIFYKYIEKRAILIGSDDRVIGVISKKEKAKINKIFLRVLEKDSSLSHVLILLKALIQYSKLKKNTFIAEVTTLENYSIPGILFIKLFSEHDMKLICVQHGITKKIPKHLNTVFPLEAGADVLITWSKEGQDYYERSFKEHKIHQPVISNQNAIVRAKYNDKYSSIRKIVLMLTCCNPLEASAPSAIKFIKQSLNNGFDPYVTIHPSANSNIIKRMMNRYALRKYQDRILTSLEGVDFDAYISNGSSALYRYIYESKAVFFWSASGTLSGYADELCVKEWLFKSSSSSV